MRSLTRLLALVLVALPGLAAAQSSSTADGLISTWTLASAEHLEPGSEPTRARNAHGLLIIDGAGLVFEFVGMADPNSPSGPASDPGSVMNRYGGFWGHYTIDNDGRHLNFVAEDGFSPSVQGLHFTREFELDGDVLVVTSGDEPQAQGHMRWTYQRSPIVENLSPAYRQVSGFWRHIEERQVNVDTGEILRTTKRAPSVIVYTPAGFVGVHFPPVGRTPFASGSPTPAEAQAALRGYIGYFGALTVYPGEVSHNVLEGYSPGPGAILRRSAVINGEELVVRIQSLNPRPANDGPRTATEVILHRLSGADDMLTR
jgi:hypothetical protein